MGRKAVIVIVVVAIIIVGAAAWAGIGFAYAGASGPVVGEDRAVTEFTKIEVSGQGHLIITPGDTAGLRIEAQQNVLDRLESTVEGDTLKISEHCGWLGWAPFWGHADITYRVTVPALAALRLSGSVMAESTEALQTEELAIRASGSSVLDLRLQAGTLSVDTSGSSDLALAGRADTVTFHSSGSTQVRARDLASKATTIECSGSSDIEVNASERLAVKASGSSDVSYLGDPQLDTDISGSGGVSRLQ